MRKNDKKLWFLRHLWPTKKPFLFKEILPKISLRECYKIIPNIFYKDILKSLKDRFGFCRTVSRIETSPVNEILLLCYSLKREEKTPLIQNTVSYDFKQTF